MNNEFFKSLNEFAELQKEASKLYEEQCSSFWENLSHDDKLAAFYSVVKRICQGELKDNGTYRYILYDLFGFDMSSYSIGMECGFLELHNSIYAQEDLEFWASRNGYIKEEKNDKDPTI